MNSELLSSPREVFIDDRVDRIIDLFKDIDEAQARGVLPDDPKLRGLHLNKDMLLLDALRARDGERVPGFEVIVTEPIGGPIEHPFRNTDFIVVSKGLYGNRVLRSNFLYMSRVHGGSSYEIAKIIGEPDSVKPENPDAEAVRLIAEIKLLKGEIVKARDHAAKTELYQFTNALLARLKYLRVSGEAKSIQIGIDKATGGIQVKAAKRDGNIVTVFTKPPFKLKNEIESSLGEFDFTVPSRLPLKP